MMIGKKELEGFLCLVLFRWDGLKLVLDYWWIILYIFIIVVGLYMEETYIRNLAC